MGRGAASALDPQQLARAFVEAPDEMPAAVAWAARRGLDLRYDPELLAASVKLDGPGISADDRTEPYLITASFDDYRALPPIWRFVDPRSGNDIGPPAYPRPVGPSVLHGQGLVCAHWSRMAYSVQGGPHSNWGGPAAWQQPVEGTVALTISDMLARLVHEVRDSRGRMGPLAR
jgi:hypothetical protein